MSKSLCADGFSEASPVTRILIVDDSRFIRRLLTQILRQHHEFFVVGEARSGAHGLEMIRKTDPDVVLLDYEMPEMNGLEMLKQLRRESAVPVIMVSGLPLEKGEWWGPLSALGVQGAVLKTFRDNAIDLSLFENELLDMLRKSTVCKESITINS